MLKRFIFSLLMLTGVTAGAVHAEDVILRVVDPSGNNVPGTVSYYTGVGGWGAEEPTPHTVDLTVGNTFWGRSKFKGQFGETGFATFTNLQNNMVSGEITEINISTGQIVNKPGNGSTEVHFVYDAFQATFGVVDNSGANISGGEVVFTNLSETYASPHTLIHYFLDGQTLSIRGKVNGQVTTTKVVTVKKNTLQRINAQDVTSVTETPGQTAARIDFQYAFFPYEVAVTDLDGNPIYALLPGTNQDDLSSKMGQVSVNQVTGGFVATGFTGSASNGTVIGVTGKFDNLESAFHSVTINEDHTVVISVGRDQNGQPVSIKSDPVETTGQTRVEFRYEPILFTTEVVNELNINLPDGLIRVTGLTDNGTTPTFVPSPFYAKVSPGRLMNFEVGFGSREIQFNLRSASSTVYLMDQDANQTGTGTTGSDQSGARVTFDDAPVTLSTTNGTTTVDGTIKIGDGTFVDSPVTITDMLDGESLLIEAQYLGVLMDNTTVTVKEGFTQYVDATSGQVISEVENGQTAIEIVFASTLVEVVVADQNGNPIYNLNEAYEEDLSAVMGDIWINTVTGGFVPSGYPHTLISGESIGVKARFDNLESPFHSVQVLNEHTVVVNVGRNSAGEVISSVNTPVASAGVTRIEFRYDPILFTTEVVNELNINLPDGMIRVVGLTDINGQENFVTSPFKAKVSAGRLMNFEVGYGSQEIQFNLRATGSTVFLLDQNGNQTGTLPTGATESGARASFDDAEVVLQTTEGTTPVAGEIKIGNGTFEASPLTLGALLDGTVLNIEAKYNALMLDNYQVSVKEDVTQTIKVSTGGLTEVSTPGTTQINIDFTTNQAPIAVIAGESTQHFYCLANAMYFELDATQTTDPDGDTPLTYRWKEGETVLHQGDGTEGNKPTLLLNVGTHVLTLEVEDPDGAIGTASVTITIENDTELPVVSISDPLENAWIKGTSTKLTGSITDNTKLKSVKIDDRNASFSGPRGDYNFTGNARLEAGENTVVVTAMDFAGNEGTQNLILFADVKKPVSDVANATLTPIAPSGATFVNGFLSANENEVQVKVTVAISDYNNDENTEAGSGIDIPNVMIGGESVTLVSGDQTNGTFEATVVLRGNGNKNIKVWAGDLSGYHSDEHIALKLDTDLPQARISSPSNNALVTTPTVTVIGDAWDNGNANEVASIDVNGVAGVFTGEGREFRAENVSPNPDGSIVVTVTDLAGKTNTTSVVVNDQSGGGGVPASLKLTLISSVESGSAPIEGVRVDLLEMRNDNERGTGKKQNTNASGVVEFEVDSEKVYRLRISHESGKYTTADMSATSNNDITVQTLLSEFTFKNSNENGLSDVRVDLMNDAGDRMLVKQQTGSNGVAGFEVLPGIDIRFRVHWLRADWVSPSALAAGNDEALTTKQATLTFSTSASSPIEGARVDLRDETGDHLCEKSHTDGSGIATFEVLPTMSYRFRVYHSGGNFLMPNSLTDGQDGTLQTVLTTLTLNDHNGTGNPIDGARIDLLDAEEKGTGSRATTGQTGHGAGVAGFEVLPNFEHKFKVSYNGGSYITASQMP